MTLKIRLIVFETLSLNFDGSLPDNTRGHHTKQLGRVLSKTCSARHVAVCRIQGLRQCF
jgi:hypothetical protein